jgi:hypothetical protein
MLGISSCYAIRHSSVYSQLSAPTQAVRRYAMLSWKRKIFYILVPVLYAARRTACSIKIDGFCAWHVTIWEPTSWNRVFFEIAQLNEKLSAA